MELLLPIYKLACSPNEPGCITYRITRSVDKANVLVYEEYIHEEAYKVTLQSLIAVHLQFLGWQTADSFHRKPGASSFHGIPSFYES